jgi:hypothetical protein
VRAVAKHPKLFICDAFLMFSIAHQLEHSEFSVIDYIALRWVVDVRIQEKKLFKMCTYMTFDPIVPFNVRTYPDQIYT